MLYKKIKSFRLDAHRSSSNLSVFKVSRSSRLKLLAVDVMRQQDVWNIASGEICLVKYGKMGP